MSDIMFSVEILKAYVHERFKIELENSTIEKFTDYLGLILTWNKIFNLTAITNPNEIIVKHFIDSLACFEIIPLGGKYSLIDIGTGAGFPGIPLKLIHPEMNLTLAESVGKKTGFCKNVAEKLGLLNVRVINKRAEEMGKDTKYRESYDYAVARAVAPLPVLVEYLLPLVKIGGSAIAMKGGDIDSERASALFATKILGGVIDEPKYLSLPGGSGKRSLIEIRKINKTPTKYPRRPGVASKKPLG